MRSREQPGWASSPLSCQRYYYKGLAAKVICYAFPGVGPMQITPIEYLRGDYRDWSGDWDGDFDYLDGVLQRHDWGDYDHATLHAQLLGWFGEHRLDWKISVLPSFRGQITPTRYRVPDLSIYRREMGEGVPTATTVPLVVVEILSPEDTVMRLA